MASPAKKRGQQQTSITNFFQAPPSKKKKKKEEEEEEQKEPKENDETQVKPAAASAAAANAVTTTLIPQQVSFSSKASWHVYQNACIYRKVRRGEHSSRLKVCGVDLDGTLLRWKIDGWPSRLEHYELWNPGVISKLREIYDQGHRLVVFSNQGAIRGAFGGKKATLCKTLVEWLAVQIDRPLEAVFSTSKKNGFHKPAPLMWTQVAAKVLLEKQDKETFDYAQSYFCGDSAGGDDDPQGGVDKGFAQAVGLATIEKSLPFFTPTEFFGPSSESEKQWSLAPYTTPSDATLQTRAALTTSTIKTPILLLLCGAQGSGKSTFCQQLLQSQQQDDDSSSNKWVHFAQDTIRNGQAGTRQAVEDATTKALKEGHSVVVDRMHLDATQREPFVQLSQQLQVPVHAVVLQPPVDTLVQRVKARQNHLVQGPAGAKLAMASSKRLVLPTAKEGFALVSASRTPEGAARLVRLYSQAVGKEAITKQIDLGNNVQLPTVLLGTMGLKAKTCAESVKQAVQLAFGGVDTAPTYKNEATVGQGLLSTAAFVTVKIPKRATTAQQVRDELTTSLALLRRTTADLVLLHWPCDVLAADTVGEVWKEMQDCVDEGLAKALGVCNFNPQALLQLLPHCTRHRPVVNQVERHFLLPQWELVDFCAQHDIVLQAHTPLGQGKLLDHPTVQQVAKRSGKTPAQVLLAWNLQQGVAVVPKCSSEEHMRQVVELVSERPPLNAKDMEMLNGVTETQRFVAPPFMFGSKGYCWGARLAK